ncbi:MAG TPA: MFS transporter [Drouetiella sp.]
MGKTPEDSTRVIDGVAFSWGSYLPALLVAGLGFFVDVYDVLLFAILRVPSLRDLGVSSANTLETGVMLLNVQMIGLILGGIAWGIIGDKKGRRAALVGSILCYSIASILNSFVDSVPAYALLRFITGFGLAGEVGAAMTIAAEITPARYRTFGTATVSLMGVFGSLLASYVGATMPWRMAFLAAGIAGLLLLCIRISMKETALFEKAKEEGVIEKHNPLDLLKSGAKLFKILRCVLVAVPLFFVFTVLVTFAPEINHSVADSGVLVAKTAAFYSLGEAIGEAVCGAMSQVLRSRKKVILTCQFCAAALTVAIIGRDVETYTLLCLPLGFFVGYWAIAITSTAEQFGTNVRSTVTTLVPNLMRACQIPLNMGFAAIAHAANPITSVIVLAVISFVLSITCAATMDETFGKDLDFLETA